MPKRIGLLLFLTVAMLPSCRSASSKDGCRVRERGPGFFRADPEGTSRRDTGITVKSVFDTEESKSTGVMNRLIAENDNPQADVYWANEPVRAEALKQRGVSTPYVSPSAEGIPISSKIPGSLLDRVFRARTCALG